jgi:hypothetical protein
MCSRDDDDSDSSLAHSSEMGQSYGTCGRGTSRQDSASQQQDLSKELMFQGIVAVQNVSEVVWDDVNLHRLVQLVTVVMYTGTKYNKPKAAME